MCLSVNGPWKTRGQLSQNLLMPRAWMLPFLVLILTGCAEPAIHLGGRPSRIPRVVSLSPSTTEIVVQDGISGQLIGRTSACNYPAYLPQLNIEVYGGVKPDYEKLAAKAPDLVVFDTSVYGPTDQAKIKEVARHTFAMHAASILDFEAELGKLGALLVAPLQMSQYVDKIEAERTTAIANAPAHHPKVVILSGNLIAGSRGFLADVVRTCGGTLAGPDADRFVDLNPESVAALNPDIILLAVDVAPVGTSIGAGSNIKEKQEAIASAALSKFRSDPRMAALRAVKSNRVITANADVVLRQGARVDQLIKSVAEIVQGGSR